MSAIAIDGPAGAGKSTVAQAVADKLGFVYVDTGAMYRAVALSALDDGVDPADPGGVAAVASAIDIQVRGGTVMVDGRDVGPSLRSGDVTRASAQVAQHPGVRTVLVDVQRRVARENDVVMEGRDIGSRVLVDAELKIFLTASLDERTRRRAREMGLTDDTEIARLREALAARDETDATRRLAPLVQAPDAIAVDTTGRSIDDVVREIVELAGEKLR